MGLEAARLERVEERYLLLGGGDGSVVLHDVERPTRAVAKRGRRKRKASSLEGHRKCVTSVEWFGGDTGLFVTGSREGQVLAWDTNEFAPVSAFALGDAVSAVRLSQAPQSAVSGLIACGTAQPAIRLCDMSSGSRAHLLAGHKGGVNGIAWSPSHEYTLVSASADKTIRVWDVRRSGASACVECLSYFQHGGAAGDSRGALAHDAEVMRVEFACGGLYLVSSGKDRRLRVWKYVLDDEKGPRYKNTLVNISRDLSSRSFSTAIASTAGLKRTVVYHPKSIQGDSCFAAFSLHSGKELQSVSGGHFKAISELVYRSSTQEVYSIGKDGLILVWSHATGTDVDYDETLAPDTWSD